MKSNKSFFGSQLRKIMFEKDITQKELAAKLGIVQQMVSFWITGKNNPTIDSIKKLSSFFDVPITYFIESNRTNINTNLSNNKNNDNNSKIELINERNKTLEEKIKRLESEDNLLKKELELIKKEMELFRYKIKMIEER